MPGLFSVWLADVIHVYIRQLVFNEYSGYSFFDLSLPVVFFLLKKKKESIKITLHMQKLPL